MPVFLTTAVFQQVRALATKTLLCDLIPLTLAFHVAYRAQSGHVTTERVNHILPIQDLKLGFKDVSHILLVKYERHVNFKGIEWPSFTTPRK